MTDRVGRGVDPELFRRTCARFGTGVTIVTTRLDHLVHGMTANAFMSVSLEPPLVLVSIAREARMARLLPTAGRFAVSILREDMRDLALHFAGRPQDDLEIPFEERAGLPVIAGALGQIIATVERVVEAGDHLLFLGRVDEMACREAPPLIFYGGRFETLAEAARDAGSEGAGGGRGGKR